MPAAVGSRPHWNAKRVRAVVAREAKDANQARRLLAIAAAYEGQEWTTAAKIGAMDPQRLRDWGHRFNAAGPEEPDRPQADGRGGSSRSRRASWRR